MDGGIFYEMAPWYGMAAFFSPIASLLISGPWSPFKYDQKIHGNNPIFLYFFWSHHVYAPPLYFDI